MDMTTTAGPSTSLPLPWVERIFQRLAALYGARWLDLWRDQHMPSVQAVWCSALAGMTGPEIARGLSACEREEFPPTAPKFALLCRPPIDPRHAFDEAVEQMRRRHSDGTDTWSHAGIFHAAVAIGGDLRKLTWRELERRWTECLEECIAAVNSGSLTREIPRPAVALPAPPVKPNPEKSAELVQRLAIDSSKDHRAWARRIIASHDKGNFVYPTVLAFAREAVDAPTEDA